MERQESMQPYDDQTLHPAAPIENEPPFAALVAIDWADKKHYWSLRAAGGGLQRGVLDNTPEAVEAWALQLRQRFNGQPIAVALEQRKGALQVMLGKYEHLYLYPVHPFTMAKYREAFFPSGSKDDGKDADLQLEILAQHRDRLRRIDPDTTEMRLLQFHVENRRKLVDERTALSNKLKDALKIYYPQIPAWFDNLTTELVGDLLEKWPTLEDLKKARPTTVEKFLREHGARDEEKIQQRLADIHQAVPATDDPAVIESCKHLVAAWTPQLKALREAIRGLEKAIRDLASAQPDWAIFDSLPGAGEVMAPRLMAALGTQRHRFQSANELQCFAGIAPVKQASGNTILIHIRWACPKFLRQTFHEWAACSIPECAWAKAYYERLKARGKSHHTAVRALAFKWMRILYRCWQQHQPYSEQIYLASLAKRGPLQQLAKSVQMP
jgi:Transposase/Transposase IS116/IS110/IS902 family